MPTNRADNHPTAKSDVPLLVLTVGALVFCFFLLQPFIAPITGAVVLATFTKGLYEALVRKIRSRGTAAVLAVLAVFICIVIPALLLLRTVGLHLIHGLAILQHTDVQSKLEALDALISQRTRNVISPDLDANELLKRAGGFLASHLLGIVRGSIFVIAQIVIMLFLLFFLYRDRPAFIGALWKYTALDPVEKRYLAGKLGKTLRATLLGRFAVATVQGVLAWITFLALGVSGAALLGNVTSLCALIPGLGAVLVWVPVTIQLALTQRWGRALILLLVGSLVISTVDNILFPFFVGTRARMHTANTFLAILGGLLLFGVSGLVLGPMLWTLSASLLVIGSRRRRQRRRLQAVI